MEMSVNQSIHTEICFLVLWKLFHRVWVETEVDVSWHASHSLLAWNIKEAIKDNAHIMLDIMLATRRRSIRNNAQFIRIDLSKNSK